MNKLNKFFRYFIISVILFIIIFFMVRPYKADNNKDLIKYISDCFTVCGGLLMCFGALTFSQNQGAFDGISYTSKSIFAKFMPTFTINPNYKDYKADKEKNRASVKYGYIIVGAIYLIIGIIISLFY